MLPAEKTRFGPYEIISLLGAGGMGEVYEARDTRLDRTVAIKICKGQITERFEREARAISSLNHPHICALYDIGREDSVDFLVMEYLEGESLEARLRKGALPIEEALRIAIQIAGALVDHGGGELRQAALAGRVIGRSRRHGDVEGDDGQGVVFGEPDLRILAQVQVLDIRGARGRGQA